VVLVSGIAHDGPLVEYVSANYRLVKHLSFRDHHQYKADDVRSIVALAKREKAFVLTTEKDAVKLGADAFSHFLSGVDFFYLPIETGFIKNGKDFDEMVLNAVVERENTATDHTF
jgi:tetraacyldisaccharide 4'-kinase